MKDELMVKNEETKNEELEITEVNIYNYNCGGEKEHCLNDCLFGGAFLSHKQ